ncbi:MAG: hypothetical protein Q8P18_30010 [Pseudomonadota bacterium]|nr:hypothetical protein [Pseudomonadota bacterium]
MESRRVLVVANKTVLGASLKEVVASMIRRGPATFVVLVPSALPDGTLVWEESAVWQAAEARAAQAVTALREMGADATGRVGAHVPYNAVMDLLRDERFDEIVVSTLPLGLSAWLGVDLPNRIRSASGLPVTHVTSDPSEPTPPGTQAE